MEQLFYPTSVVVIGVSNSSSNLARNIVSNLQAFSYSGEVMLVGKEGGMLENRKIYDELAKIPKTPDLAVILTPAQTVYSIMEECGKAGIHWVIIESSGFSEYSEDRKDLEDQLLALAKKYNIRFVGPNCIGIMNFHNGLVVPFTPVNPTLVRKGPLSFISQSGAIGSTMVKLMGHENLGINKIISMGNKLDLKEGDYLQYLAQDPETSVIGLYLEGVSNGRELLKIASSISKPIIVLKANTSSASNEIARFHTSAMAGDDTVCEAVFVQAGLHRVKTLTEMRDHFKIFLLPPMKGRNIVVIGRSGGHAVLAADAAKKYNFNLCTLPGNLLESISKHLRAGVIRLTNPLDLGDLWDFDFYASIIEMIIKEKTVDGVLLMQTYTGITSVEEIRKPIYAVQEFCKRYKKPIVVCFIADRPAHFDTISTSDFPLFSEAEYALRALATSYRHWNRQRRVIEPPMLVSRENVGEIHQNLAPDEALSRLISMGIKVPEFRVTYNLNQTINAANQIGYPVALKINSRRFVHKTEVQGVVTDILDETSLCRIFQEMEVRLAGTVADDDKSYLLQEMVSSRGIETIVGTRNDSEFGPIVIFGLGGVFTEVLGDIAIRVAPISEKEAEEMINQIKGHTLFKKFRNNPARDVKDLARIISTVSRALFDFPDIVELEINPLSVFFEGEGCMAIDARIRVRIFK